MSAARRSGLRLVFVFAIFLIAGCASNTRARGPFDENFLQWQGRLALQIHSTPEQAFSANFDLQGTPQEGKLTFSTPLGTVLARLQWNALAATLQARGETQHFDSLDALTRHTTGTDLPIASLFGWLQGQDAPAPGWEVDLQNLPSGRLTARKLGPDAPADLKILLER